MTAATPLLLVDGHNLLNRAWHGFPARIWDRARTVDLTGVFGFAALLRKAQLVHAPGHELVVVFDGESGAPWRVAADAGYKAGRADPEKGLIRSLRGITRTLDWCGVRWLELADCEADDVIAALTVVARRDGRPVDVMSTDKDFLQLLTDPGVRLLHTGLHLDRRYATGDDVRARYGVEPATWSDFRALTGDPADGIRGLCGVGPKTAARLLTGAGHLERIPADRLRPEWISRWPDVLRWRDMIRLDRGLPLPGGLLAGTATRPLPLAARQLEAVGLW